MGLSLHNGLAVLEGLLGKKTPFIRTPKFNIQAKSDSWKKNVYLSNKVTLVTLLEGLLCVYFIAGGGLGVYLRDFTLIVFHLMLAVGYGAVFFQSIKPIHHAA